MFSNDEQIQIAERIRSSTPVPVFSEMEQQILLRVFSNCDKNTFFIYGLPEELITALLARYSRIKNKRGLRGVFLDDFIPNLPVIGRIFTDPKGYCDEYGNKKIGDISIEEIEKLIGFGFSLESYHSVVTAEKIKGFLKKYLDDYGHNSIARMGVVHLAVENVSLLAAKAIEWSRPGAGYIELSTRFVDMGAQELYPIWEYFGNDTHDRVKEHIINCNEAYKKLYTVCEDHFRNIFREHDPSNGAIQGKVCDSLGNLLPCATLTSLGVSLMGEAYHSVIKHLFAEESPECFALAYEIIEEAKRVGNSILLSSHYRPLASDYGQYKIGPRNYQEDCSSSRLNPNIFLQKDFILPNALALESIIRMSGLNIDEEFLDAKQLFADFRGKRTNEHASYEKLPDWFEHASAIFSGWMSFRSWRDLQRMGFCTHKRGYITPGHGVYLPPDMPQEFIDMYQELHIEEGFLFSSDMRHDMHCFDVNAQYAYMIGNLVPFIIGANLREWEFVTWQRTKWQVNEEVRKVVLEAEEFLRYEYPWWERISRADTTWEYVFARGQKAIPKTK